MFQGIREETIVRKRFLVSVFALVFLGMAAAPCMAAPAERFPISDVIFERVNDCTGNVTTWTQSNQFMRIQESAPGLADHNTLTITGDVSTADGFAGRFHASSASNLKEVDPLPVGEQAIVNTYILHDASGRLLLTHEVLHVVFLPDGETKGTVINFDSRCLGRPN